MSQLIDQVHILLVLSVFSLLLGVITLAAAILAIPHSPRLVKEDVDKATEEVKNELGDITAVVEKAIIEQIVQQRTARRRVRNR
jgi:hypothetical protein